MSFMIYERKTEGNIETLISTKKPFQLAGYGLIRKIWQLKDRPANCGWRITEKELITAMDNKDYVPENCRLIIEANPKRGELARLMGIYLYTYRENENIDWTPLMLEMNLVYEDEKNKGGTREKFTPIPEPENFISFLYLRGDLDGWNWGYSASTGGAFLSGEARKYFKKFF